MFGGINEVFLDIVGEVVEYFMCGNVDWIVGVDIFKFFGGLCYFD